MGRPALASVRLRGYFPESPFVEEFSKKYGNDQVRVDGVGNEAI